MLLIPRYLKILRAGYDSNLVHSVTNLVDLYFHGGKEHRLEVASMKDVPYFEGDYWPGEAEVVMDKIGAEGAGGSGGGAGEAGGRGEVRWGWYSGGYGFINSVIITHDPELRCPLCCPCSASRL